LSYGSDKAVTCDKLQVIRKNASQKKIAFTMGLIYLYCDS